MAAIRSAHVEQDRGFWQATLDALPDSLVVLDDAGKILAVNGAWSAFAVDNGGADVGVGVNYLSVCDRSADDEPIAGEVAQALRDIVAGDRPEYERLYPCHAPWQDRWFVLRIAPFTWEGRRRLALTHHDVTTRYEAQRRTREQAELLDAVDAAIIATDLHGRVTSWSQGAEQLYGWSADETIGHPITEFRLLRASRVLGQEILSAVLETDQWEGQLDVVRRDGTHFPVYVRNQLLADADGQPTGVVGVSVDLTERMAMERQLRGARDFLAAVTHTVPNGLLVLDAEGRVTLINEAAEQALGWPHTELFGALAQEEIHALDADGAPRPAADRPLAPDLAPGAIARVADDVFQRRDGTLLPVEYAAAPFTAEDGEQGMVVVFSDISVLKARELSHKRELEALSWVGRIRDALDEDRLVLYAQPIVDIVTGETVQHELLLLRMRTPNGEVVMPNAFLPVAEQHGLICAIDRRVFELALDYAAAGHPIEVNVSADSISDPGLFRFVEQQIAARGVDPRLVVFEITETALIHNEAIAQAFIENVRRLECAVALDDFGTGYGSFRYLKHLPVSLLKIDQEFIRDLEGDDLEVNRHVIKAIVTLARGMGQKTVAEGVETEAALEHLRTLGVDYAQGYYFAHPAPAEGVFRRLAGARVQV